MRIIFMTITSWELSINIMNRLPRRFYSVFYAKGLYWTIIPVPFSIATRVSKLI